MSVLPKKIKIFLMGEEYHAKEFCEQLEIYEKSVFEPKFYKDLPSNEVLSSFNIFHLISSPLPVIKKLRHYSKPIFYHWIGTDVYRFYNDYFFKRNLKKIIINSSKVFNLVVSENLKCELEKFDINSKILPLTKLKVIDDLPPMPSKFSVLTYIPKKRWDFYNGDLINELSLRLPDIDFHLLAVGEDHSGKPNVFYYNFVEDSSSFYKKCSVLLRLTLHDGLPKMVLEALSYGRQVLWNESFPYCFQVKDLNECIEVLKKLKSDCPINIEGKKFVDDSFSESKIIGDYYQLCNDILLNQ